MAFSLNTWARISNGVYEDSVVAFGYSTDDSFATVTTAGYFNAAPEVGGNDCILAKTSDGIFVLKTTLSGGTLTASPVNLGVDSVGTAEAAFPTVVLNSKYTTVAGSATQVIHSAGLTAADSTVQATLRQEGQTPVTIKTAVVNDGNVTIYMSGDPGADHVINVTVTKG